MATAKVRAYLAQFGKEADIIEVQENTATVALAAEVLGVSEAQIAKTLAFRRDEESAYLVVYAGDVRVDNSKWKSCFGRKASMLDATRTELMTGFAPGGVCPFALPTDGRVKLYMDVSLRRFDKVYPACGAPDGGIGLTPDELFTISGAIDWVDTAKYPSEEETV